jgi:hypothetical protein
MTPRIEYQVNPRFVPDDIPVWLGNSKDAALIFDNANDELTFQTRDAAGTLTDRLRIKANTNTPSPDLADNPLKWTAGRAVTAADYSIGRDLDATNQLHLNVPTGATFELSVNDTPEFVVSATQVDVKSNDLVNVNSATITGATGNTLVVDTNVLVVDATNNRVGIGGTIPRSPLDVINGLANVDGESANAAHFTAANQTGLASNLAVNTNNAQAIDMGGSISLGGLYRALARDNVPFALIKAGKTNSTDDNTAGYLTLGTRVNGGASVAERIRLDNLGNMGIGTPSEFGGGVKVVGLANATTVPASNPTAGGVLYAEAGALKWRGSSGTITTIAVA